MTGRFELTSMLGIGDREVVSIVGAGGKSTLLLGLGAESVGAGRSVVITTTTKMAREQIPEGMPVVLADDEALPGPGSAVFAVGHLDGDKVLGVAPAVVDRWHEAGVDHILVEADGARQRYLKAPRPGEPVIASSTTLVVVVAGLAALGRPIAEVAHRPERVAELVGCAVGDPVSPEMVATVVSHPDGGLKEAPADARVVVALTGRPSSDPGVRAIVRTLTTEPRIASVAVLSRPVRS